MTTNSVVTGSLSAIAQRDGLSLAESMLNVEIILLIDSSGSMAANDSRGGNSRWDVAVDELTQLQRDHPGKIGVVSFSSDVEFAPSGIPPFLGGGTDLTAGLHFVHQFDGTVRFIVISDGSPDDERSALAEAATFNSSISTVYCGPEDERSGMLFLERLAKVAGGQSVNADRAMELAKKVETLFLVGK